MPAPALICLAMACCLLPWPSCSRTAPAAEGHLPVADPPIVQFVANGGPWAPEVAFTVLGGGTAAWVVGDGFVQRFERWTEPAAAAATRTVAGAVVRTRFRGACGHAVGELPTGTRYTHLRGPHRVEGGGFARVRIADLLPGVDLVLRGQPGGEGLAYDLLLRPGVDLDAVVADCEGVRAVAIADDGALLLHVPMPDGGEVTLRQTRPVAWQTTRSGDRPVEVGFRLVGPHSFGFRAEGLDPEAPLVIDPGLVWSTLLGGGRSDSIQAMRFLPGQGVYVGGWAGSTDFPTTTGAFRSTGGRDAFVARLADDGRSVLWATYLGGSAVEEVRGIALGPDLSVTAVGFTTSTDFPVVASAFQPAYAGASVPANFGDGFVVRLSPDGSTLLGGTYLGGGSDDVAEGVVVAANGDAFVCGWTSSANFPTTAGTVQPVLGGPAIMQTDGFVVRLAPDGRTLVWSTFLGGEAGDQLFDIALDAAGRPTVVGNSLSTGYPITVNAYRTTSSGGAEVVVTRLAADGRSLPWSTFLGGVGNDHAHGLAVAADGSTWLCGTTASVNFPTTAGAFQRQRDGATDGFVARLSAGGQALLFSSLLGGPEDDTVRAIAIAPGGAPFVVGETMGGFPVTAGATQPQFGGGTLDGFVAEFDASGASLAFASYLGGSNDDFLVAAARGNNGLAVAAGFTFSADFPTTMGALQGQLRGVEDGVVAQFDLDSQLDGSLVVAAGEPVPARRFEPLQLVDALTLRLRNETTRRLLPQSVRVFVGGAGDARLLHGVSIWRDDVAAPGGRLLLDGPRSLAQDNDEVELSLLALGSLPIASGVDLRVVLHGGVGLDEGSEFACAVLGNGAWSVAAEGSGTGPRPAVTGSSRLLGPAFVVGEPVRFDGDDDGDGAVTVRDLRRLCQRLGQPAGAADPDGDGFITARDLEQVRSILLGRAVVQDVPPAQRGGFGTLRGFFAAPAVAATLGGRVLELATATPRELAFRIEPTAPVGVQTLTVVFAGYSIEVPFDVR